MLEKLYNQYRKGNKPRFASRFYNWIGRTFIGTPAELGLENLRPDHEAQFYMVKTDRLPPEDKTQAEAWSKAAIQPNIKRVSMLSEVGRGAFYVAVVLVIALCAGAWGLGLSKKGVEKFTSSDTQGEEASQPQQSKTTVEDCNKVALMIQNGEVSKDSMPPAFIKRCNELTN